MIKKIIKGHFQFISRRWKTISPDAKALVVRMLQHSPDKRPSAAETLNDPWLNRVDFDFLGYAPEVAMMWGEFITACIDFILVAFVMFLIIKGMNALKKKEEAPAPVAPKGPSQEELLSEIRDLLKK